MSFSIIGTGSALPQDKITNNDLKEIVDTSDEWISTRTGIKQRHICAKESITDLAVKAAKQALIDANTEAKDIDLIILATISSDYITPSLACIVQKSIGAVCPAFDLNAACTGFIYALDIAASYFESNRANKILVVAADAMSRLLDFKDRATCVLFGDAASAVVLKKGDDLLSIKLTATGDDKALYAKNVIGNCPFKEEDKADTFIHMNGQEIYKFAVTAMCNDINDVIETARIDREKISYVLPHQANIRIIEAAQKKLKIDPQKYLANIDRYGNTSAVSIPLLIDEANKNGKFKNGDILVLSAFGAGLTTGACVIRWNK